MLLFVLGYLWFYTLVCFAAQVSGFRGVVFAQYWHRKRPLLHWLGCVCGDAGSFPVGDLFVLVLLFLSFSDHPDGPFEDRCSGACNNLTLKLFRCNNLRLYQN